MNSLNISENIIRLRREKKITQEELADFVGVTKASVSKWENRQSLPDILLLPQLAAFFNVSIDELVGYRPQLSREQIQKLYQELSSQFASQPFDEVMDRCRKLVKQYYSCCPFLFQVCVLWLNHFMLAQGQEQQKGILKEASELCGHILEDSRDIGLCNDTVILRASIDLLLGKAETVIETLEEAVNPYRLAGQSDTILVQAYQLAGKTEKAEDFTQISMFRHLINFIEDSVWHMELHKDDLAVCDETIRRIDGIDHLYGIRRLNVNTAAQFQLQSAIVYSLHGRKEEALERLEQYAAVIRWMFEGENLRMHGDDYFDRISVWYESCDLGNQVPRDRETIKNSALQAFSHPSFAPLSEDAKFQRIRKGLEAQMMTGKQK